MNLLTIPTLILTLLLFATGQRSIHICKTTCCKLHLTLLWCLAGIPGFLFALYYLHLFDSAAWFYAFRSIPFIELSAAGAGLTAGAISELLKDFEVPSSRFLISLLCIGIVTPYLKPIIRPLDKKQLQDRWDQDVCVQSTPSTCGPASAATVFKTFGVNLTEQQIAKECFSYEGGTENWYIARAFRKRGFGVNYRIEKQFPPDLKTPVIAGVLVGRFGHFIAIQGQTEKEFITGDPLSGYRKIPKNQIADSFRLTGFFMEIQPPQ